MAKMIAGVALVILLVLGLYFTGVLKSIIPGTYICDQEDVDLVIVTDLSNSMDDNCFCADGTPSNNGYCTTEQGYPFDTNLPCNLYRMKEATKSLITNMLTNPDNKVGIVAFSTRLEGSSDLTHDAHMLVNTVDLYDAISMTCPGCGLHEAIDIIKYGTNPKKVIVLMTDGDANRCYPGIVCTNVDAENELVGMAAQAYADYGVEIYTVAYEYEGDTVSLQKVAEQGHGQYFVAAEDSIYSIYAEIGEIVTCVACNEDGICDSGENCQRCPLDCIVPVGSVCCNGEIKKIECQTNADCNDNDECTNDVCNTEVCAGVCSNTLRPGYKYDAWGNCKPPCSDGTEWGMCSKDSIGYYCE